MFELNEVTKDILGTPNFKCASIAGALRAIGRDVPTKAEDEQAHAIHFMLEMYEKHGSVWRVEVGKMFKDEQGRIKLEENGG